MQAEAFETEALTLLALTDNPHELSEPQTLRFERIGVAARDAWVHADSAHPVLQLINATLSEGNPALQKLVRLYVLPNLHLIGVSSEAQQAAVKRLPEPLRSEWLSTQHDLDALQKQAE